MRKLENQLGFLQSLLELVANAELDLSVRQAAALYFKNSVKRRWSDDEASIVVAETEKVAIKSHIITVMVMLPPTLQKQLGEAVTLIAAHDFPTKWENLIDELASRINIADMHITNGVLQTAHSIFKRWRSQFRTDDLFREIAFVLERFCEPFLSIFKQTDVLIKQNAGNVSALDTLFRTMFLLSKIYYDLNCQDIPEFFEDHIGEFMSVFHGYLTHAEIRDAESRNLADHIEPLQEVKSCVCEIAELYTQRYEEVFAMLPQFVQSVWSLLEGLSMEVKHDILASRALSFLTCVVNSPRHANLFQSEQVLRECVEKIALPNMALREADLELIEDDPIEFIRRDLEGSDNDTRRRSATDFIRSLSGKFEKDVIALALVYVNHYLAHYRQNTARNWRAKDSAIYLISSVAVSGRVTKTGVSAINPGIDIQEFFKENVLSDLRLQTSECHPIITVDAIKFIHVFRNQLSKDQIVAILALLAYHLRSTHYVVFTYSAVTVDALLSMTSGATSLFTKEDVASISRDLLQSLFALVLRGQSPETIAENDFLMKCIMRVILAAQDTIQTQAHEIVQQLTSILGQVCKNPANPLFNHYLFECYGALVRFIGPLSEAALAELETAITGPLLNVLQADVTEFAPYVFQLWAQIIEFHKTTGLSSACEQLLPPILSPNLWDTKANIPALVRLLQAFITHDPSRFSTQSLLEPVLGIYQKLIASKANDEYGFSLIETAYTSLPQATIEKYNHQIFLLLLLRLNGSRTEKFLLRFILFIFYLSNLRTQAGPDFVIAQFETIQQG